MAVRLLAHDALALLPRMVVRGEPGVWLYRRTLCVPNADDWTGSDVRERINVDLAASGACVVFDSWAGITVRWLYRPDELPEDAECRTWRGVSTGHDHIVVRALVERADG